MQVTRHCDAGWPNTTCAVFKNGWLGSYIIEGAQRSNTQPTHPSVTSEPAEHQVVSLPSYPAVSNLVQCNPAHPPKAFVLFSWARFKKLSWKCVLSPGQWATRGKEGRQARSHCKGSRAPHTRSPVRDPGQCAATPHQSHLPSPGKGG